jgi:hypothetical protein
MARMSISLRRRQWVSALADLDDLLRRSVLQLGDVERSPLFADLVRTSEYVTWRAQRH